MGSVRLAFVISLGAAVIVACSAYEEAAPDPGKGTDGGTDGGTEDAADATSDTGGPTGPTWLPPEGAYRYRVTGKQRLSIGVPEYRDEGPVAAAEIRPDGDPACWRFRLCLVSGKCDSAAAVPYSEIDWSFCVDSGRLEERSAKETSRWFAFGDLRLAVSTVTCDPGQAVYARTDLSMASWAHLCQGTVDGLTFASSGPYRYLGEDSVQIGTAPVHAYHYAEERTVAPNALSAPQGKQIGEWWFAANGLPLRVRRGASINTDVGLGVVEFRQTSGLPADGGELTMDDCVLDSLTPTALPTLDASADAPNDAPTDAADGG